MACATRLQKRNNVGVLRARRVVEGRAAPPVARAVVRAELLDEAYHKALLDENEDERYEEADC